MREPTWHVEPSPYDWLPEPCWIVDRPKPDKTGYIQVNCNGKMRSFHRIAWEREHGPVPDKMLVCHRCDRSACCQPAHLFLGTHKDNTHDMITKGRWRPRGPNRLPSSA